MLIFLLCFSLACVILGRQPVSCCQSQTMIYVHIITMGFSVVRVQCVSRSWDTRPCTHTRN